MTAAADTNKGIADDDAARPHERRETQPGYATSKFRQAEHVMERSACRPDVVGDRGRAVVVRDHEQPVAARPGGTDRLERGQGVIRAFVLSDHAP